MKLSRRQFVGLLGGISLSSCAQVKKVNWEKLKPEIDLHWGKEGPLVFAAINDLHVLDAKSTGIVNRAVNQINADKEICFTVVLGDVATAGRFQELSLVKQSLTRLERPYFCVPGNHDVDPKAPEIYGAYDQHLERRQWKEGEEGWLFLGLDTCNGTSSNVTVPQDRMDWLAAQVKKVNPERPIALFTHHPFNPNTKAYRVKNAEEVIALFEGHNLKLVASGHYHGNQIEERDGILFTTTACCSSTRGNFDKTPEKGYRLFRIENDAITHSFVEVPT